MSNLSKYLVEKLISQLLLKMENCILSYKQFFCSITWGNPDMGKLGHGSIKREDPDKKA